MIKFFNCPDTPGPFITNRFIYFSLFFLSQVANIVMARSGKVKVSSRFHISEIQAYFFRMLGTEFERTSYCTLLGSYCLASFVR